MSEFTHIVLTRFNAQFGASWTELALNSEWLEHRFNLFERFCYPSLRSQTIENFIWLVFFSDKTPQKYRDRINNLAEQWHVMRPLFHDYLSGEVVMNETLKCISKKNDFIITSTVDNDYSISKNYIEETQKQFKNQSFQYVNWALGYVYHVDKHRFYKRYYKESPFNSLIECVEGCKLVWSTSHNELLSTGNVIQIDKNPGWIQVVHNKNISNRIKGRRIRTPDVVQYFNVNIGLVTQENLLNIFIDRHILFVLRLLRDGLIMIAKQFIDLQNLNLRLIKIKSGIFK